MPSRNQTDDVVELPEDDVLDDAQPAQRARRGISPTVKLLAIAGLGMIAVFALLFMSAASNQDASAMRRPPTLDATPGGANQATNPMYQDSIRQANEDRAVEAADLGITSMPVPEVNFERVEPIQDISQIRIEALPVETEPEPQVVVRERRILPRPTPAPRVVVENTPAAQPEPEVVVVEVEVESGEPQEPPPNPYITSISAMMQQTAQAFAPKPMAGGQISAAQNQPEAGQNGNADPYAQQVAGGQGAGQGNPYDQMAQAQGSAGADYSPDNILMRPGDILYAETLTTVTSDMQAPVMAEIVHGDYKGGRVVGSFATDFASGKMVVQFSNMTLPDGRVFALSAVAVDGQSAETAVRSDIERRYIARYAPILAATFVSSYAQAMSASKKTIVNTTTGTQIVEEPSTSREAAMAGMANAAGVVASDIMAHAPRGPKITLQSGWPLGILIVEPVLIDNPSGAARGAQAGIGGIQPGAGSPPVVSVSSYPADAVPYLSGGTPQAQPQERQATIVNY